LLWDNFTLWSASIITLYHLANHLSCTINKTFMRRWIHYSPPHKVLFIRIVLCFFCNFFFQFHISILDLLGIRHHNLFLFDFYRVIFVSRPLLQVWLVSACSLKFFILFLLICFSISSINIRLIENWISYFVSISCIWGYLSHMI
jgi:hypothetical protein